MNRLLAQVADEIYDQNSEQGNFLISVKKTNYQFEVHKAKAIPLYGENFALPTHI